MIESPNKMVELGYKELINICNKNSVLMKMA